MKKYYTNNPTQTLFLAALFVMVTCLVFGSCISDPPNTNKSFAGTYKGSNTCDTGTSNYYTIKAGSNNNSVYLPVAPGSSPSCTNSTFISAVVSGHNVTAVPQNLYDACNRLFTYSASGTLSGDTLAITVSTIEVGVSTVTCTFNGLLQ